MAVASLDELHAQWIRTAEEYYNARYSPAMRREVVALLPRSRRALGEVLRECYRVLPAQYGKLPDVAVLEQAVQRVKESREVEADQLPQDVPQLEDDGFVDPEVAHEFWRRLNEHGPRSPEVERFVELATQGALGAGGGQ